VGRPVTIDVIGEIALGYPFHAFDEERNGEALAILESVDTIFKEFAQQVLNPFRPYMPWNDGMRKFNDAQQTYREIVQRIYQHYLNTPAEQRDVRKKEREIHTQHNTTRRQHTLE